MSKTDSSEEIDWKIKYPNLSLYSYFLEIAKKFDEDKILFEEGNQKFTSSKIIEMSNKLAKFFDDSSVEVNDTISIILPNSIWFVVSIFAAYQVGAKVTLINPRLSQKEIAFQLTDSETKVLITNNTLCMGIKEVINQFQFKAKIIVADQNFNEEDIQEMISQCDFVIMKSIMESQHAFTENRSRAEDIAFLLYTGGTTGSAKAVMLKHSNVLANALQFNEWANKIPSEYTGLVASALPMCHSFGLQCSFFAPLFRGEKIAIIPKFDPKAILQLIEDEKATSFYGVPTMYVALLRQQISDFDTSSLKVCVSGGAALPKEVHSEFKKATGVDITEGFGLTECSPVTHINPYGASKVNSIGQPLTDTLAKVVDTETLEEIEIGEVGEIIIYGPQVMKGYWGKGMESLNVFTPEKWLRTGDLAQIDSDGYFFIVDRSKDIINSGGLKVYPREVEELLFKHPKISLAAVIAVPDDYFGEVGKAFIVLKEGEDATPEEIKEFCIEQSLTKYKIPKSFEFIDELPLSAAGKVLKRELVNRETKK
ncbi:MAG: long-chain fatty acid--CoA ligase [Candidatus Heimdallarchaeota archaeon]|nr:long-chain fatty acid--CoA ligase [Candidatus Heimdallarchaeota archaeon]